MTSIKGQLDNLLIDAGDIRCSAEELQHHGIEVNSVLISNGRVNISLRKGIEKAAGAVGAELSTSPSGQHLNFDYKNAYFGQRKKG